MFRPLLLEALKLASRRRGFCAPNPAVGAVVVRDGEIVGRGFHPGAGQPHAEVRALEEAGELARGAQLYCTLEPCCHFGRTPPCTDLIIETGIARVVYGFRDPHAVVAGKGHLKLEAAGIACVQETIAEIDAFYSSYSHWIRTGRPVVTAKIATTLDGKISGPGGVTVTVTGEEAARLTHERRWCSDGILTTVQTLLADDPRLNARTAEGAAGKPVYVVDTHGRMPERAKVLETSSRVTVLHGPSVASDKVSRLVSRGVRAVSVASGEGGLDVGAVLQAVGADGIHDLWVEAGGRFFAALARGGWIDRAYVYLAPRAMGTSEAVSAWYPQGDWTERFSRRRWLPLGTDVALELER